VGFLPILAADEVAVAIDQHRNLRHAPPFCSGAPASVRTPTDKSFLVLFFKKEQEKLWVL
jgi:hypothetical protein